MLWCSSICGSRVPYWNSMLWITSLWVYFSFAVLLLISVLIYGMRWSVHHLWVYKHQWTLWSFCWIFALSTLRTVAYLSLLYMYSITKIVGNYPSFPLRLSLLFTIQEGWCQYITRTNGAVTVSNCNRCHSSAIPEFVTAITLYITWTIYWINCHAKDTHVCSFVVVCFQHIVVCAVVQGKLHEIKRHRALAPHTE